MKLRLPLCLLSLLLVAMPSFGYAENTLIEDFKSQPDTRWRFIADTVMGGVSEGKIEFFHDNGDAYARMTGNVSTANNGGFIQFPHETIKVLACGSVGLKVSRKR